LALKAVGEWFSFLVTCITGHIGWQYLCPELKHTLAAALHFSSTSRSASEEALGSGLLGFVATTLLYRSH
jgi:hypothetical protein